MTFPQNTSPGPQGSETPEAAIQRLEASVQSTQKLLNVVMASLLVLTVSLFAFVLRELRFVRRQIAENTRYVQDYRTNWEPRIAELQSKLLDYTKSHPGFAPVFVKYFGSPTNTPTPTSIAPAPSSTAPPGPRSQPPPR